MNLRSHIKLADRLMPGEKMNVKVNYLAHEVQRLAFAPVIEWCGFMSRLFQPVEDLSLQSNFLRPLSAGYEVIYRIGKTYKKPEFGIKDCSLSGDRATIQEKVEISLPFCRLLNFKKTWEHNRDVDQPKVLIVAPLSGHHATLIKDTVRALIPHNDVYVTDWIDAKLVNANEGQFGLNEYVKYVKQFITSIGDSVHVVAICQPTVPVLGAVSLMASANEVQPRSIVLLAGPIDTRVSPTKVNKFAENNSLQWFEKSLIDKVPANYPGAGRKVYPGFVQHAAFIAMNPQTHIDSHNEFYRNASSSEHEKADSHRNFYDEYNAVLDMPAEFYLDTIKTVFKDHQLPRGTWEVSGTLVTPKAITKPALMTIEGEKDDICGHGQTFAAHELCAGIDPKRKHHYVVEGAGHYGVFSGRKWRDQVAPMICKFIKEHN